MTTSLFLSGDENRQKLTSLNAFLVLGFIHEMINLC